MENIDILHVERVPLPKELCHHKHHVSKEEIEVAAWWNWCASGKPLFNNDITFANWIDAELRLEHPYHHAPVPPPDIE